MVNDNRTRPWHLIHDDFKTTNADGRRLVLVFEPGVGTCLVPWQGAGSLTAHASAVSRTLARAGFDRAESESTSVRGYRRYYPGFVVTRRDGHVRVAHSAMNDSPDADRRPWREAEAEALAKYADALRGAGYTVVLSHELHIDGHSLLRVTREETP